MLRTRVIPCLLLANHGLVKSIKFKNPTYVGDPVNAVKIFNEKEADELILLDTLATREQQSPDFDLIQEIASECFMPVCYGGGINNLEMVQRLLTIGIEKVAINTAAIESPQLISQIANNIGSQSLVIAIDVKRGWRGNYEVFSHAGQRKTGLDAMAYAKEVESLGAGEIMINSIDRDGTRSGLDLDLTRALASAVKIPVISCGGIGQLDDIKNGIKAGASAIAAGSMFVFNGPHRAVLISYPSSDEIAKIPAHA